MVENSGHTPMHVGDRWWGNIADPLRHLAAKVADFFAPAAEASRTDDHYDISIELPGVAEDDITIHVEHDTLIVSGEKNFSRTQEGRDFFFSEFSYGKFQRSFHLPEDASQDDIKATYKDGVLNVEVGKRGNGKTGKQIPIAKT